MSRIGKKPIEIPQGVEVRTENNKVVVKGPKGELQKEIRPEIGIEVKEGKIFVLPKVQTKGIDVFWGLNRAVISNMIEGVTKGYEKKLEIEGLGYKALMEGETLVLYVGFTTPVKIIPPKTIKVSVEKNVITVSGVDKELVGQISAKIRKVKPPEPYKGKGIRYLGEVVRRKVGKKAITVTG